MNISGTRDYSVSQSTRVQTGTPAENAGQAQFSTDTPSRQTAVVAQSEQAAGQSEAQQIADKLAAIKQKPAVERTREDSLFIEEHDQRFAEITAKPESQRTADDLNYLQKATGFVNTMAMLSKEEKALYDEFKAAGNTQAVEALSMIALTRHAFTGEITLPDGRSYNPRQTEITPENIEQYFRRNFGAPDDDREQAFDALIAALTKREAANV